MEENLISVVNLFYGGLVFIGFFVLLALVYCVFQFIEPRDSKEYDDLRKGGS